RDKVVGDYLEDTDRFDFLWMSEKEVQTKINNGKAEVGIEMKQEGFRILAGVDSGWADLIRHTLQKAYMKKMQYEQVLTEVEEGSVGPSDLLDSINSPVFTIETRDFQSKDVHAYDRASHILFAMYTSAKNVFHSLIEKEDRIWDRIILSPVNRWEMYAGNFVYSFLAGYFQILIILLVFRYIAGVDFEGNFVSTLLALIPYVFAIVSLCILITGLVKTTQLYNVVTSVMGLALVMIGGAFWPLEVVETKWILALSKIDPVTYGLEVANGAVYGD